MPIKSHIYIPESILNRFSYRNKDNKKIIHFIDVKEKQIKTTTTRGFNSEFGYYTEDNENFLSREIESNIGMIIRKIEDNIKQDNYKIPLSLKEEKYIIDYLTYSFLRCDYESNHLNSLLNLETDIKTVKNAIIELEIEKNRFGQEFSNYHFIFLYNSTSEEFVLPSNFIYEVTEGKGNSIIIEVLTPKIAIQFFNEDELKKMNIKNNVKIINDNEQVKLLNKKTVSSQSLMKSNYIIGNEKSLISILNYIKKN